MTIEERAKEHFAHNWKGSVIDAYKEGANDQQKIDINKAWNWIKDKVELSYTDYDSYIKAMEADD